MTMSGDMLLAAPISSFGPHFDFVQSCAFAAPPANSKATEQPNTNALRIAVPPRCLALWFCAGQRLILAEVACASRVATAIEARADYDKGKFRAAKSSVASSLFHYRDWS